MVWGILAGLDIWELAILPDLLNNGETWIETATKTLDDLQCMFYRYLLATPRKCPIQALLGETGGIMMEHRIAQKRLLLFHHLIKLPKKFPGIWGSSNPSGLLIPRHKLIEESILKNAKSFSKIQWKKLVKKTSSKKNRKTYWQQSWTITKNLITKCCVKI